MIAELPFSSLQRKVPSRGTLRWLLCKIRFSVEGNIVVIVGNVARAAVLGAKAGQKSAVGSPDSEGASTANDPYHLRHHNSAEESGT